MDSISRETFDQMDTDSKLNVLFDYVKDTCDVCRTLGDKLESKKKIDTGIAAIAGFVGGVIAHLGQLTFFGRSQP